MLATANNESQNGGIDSHQSLKLLGHVMWEEYKSQIFLKKACERLNRIINLSINAKSSPNSLNKKQVYLRSLYELVGVRGRAEIQDFFNINDLDDWWELFGDTYDRELTSAVCYLAHEEVFNETEKNGQLIRLITLKKTERNR